MKKYLLILFICFLTGCSSSGPTASESSGSDGYTIMLSLSENEIESGGSVAVTAVVKDPDGNLISNEDKAVLFTFPVSGSDFDDKLCDIKGGVAQTILKWEDDGSSDQPEPSKYVPVTASYKGAEASVKVYLISEDF